MENAGKMKFGGLEVIGQVTVVARSEPFINFTISVNAHGIWAEDATGAGDEVYFSGYGADSTQFHGFLFQVSTIVPWCL